MDDFAYSDVEECINCDAIDDFCFFEYEGKDESLSYFYCDHCGIFWKEFCGGVVAESITYSFFDRDWLVFDLQDIISTSFYKKNIRIGGILNDFVNKKMTDYFRRCIGCNEIISNTTNSEGCYSCKQCGFEWGVVEIG